MAVPSGGGLLGWALVTRIHHAIADGIALVSVMLSLTGDVPSPPEPEPQDQVGFGALLKPTDAIDQGWKATGSLLDIATSPARMLGLAVQSTEVAAELGWLLAMPKG